MSKRNAYISDFDTNEEIVSKKAKNITILKEGDLITFNGTNETPWSLGVALGNKNKVLIIYESNILTNILSFLQVFLKQRENCETKLEECLDNISEHKIRTACNSFEILNINILYPPNNFKTCEFIEVLIFNLKIIENIKVGDIIKYNKIGMFYQTGLFTDQNRCQIAYCKSDVQFYNKISYSIKYSNILELASNNKLEIMNNVYEETFHFKPMSERDILCRIDNVINNFGKYDGMFNNCEHFVTECRYGHRKSLQVLNVFNMVYVIYSAFKGSPYNFK